MAKKDWLPSAFYLVVSDYERFGFGCVSDPTIDRANAMDALIEARSAGQPARAFHIEHGAGVVEDVTGEIMAAAFAMWSERGDAAPEWAVSGEVAA